MAQFSNITAERVRYLFRYDKMTGKLIRVIYQKENHIYDAISKSTRTVFIDGERHSIARVIWLYHYGKWPPVDSEIDHRNLNHQDNRIDNLRIATPTQNGYNRAMPANENGRGVTSSGKIAKPWRAQMRINGRKTNLGHFKTREEAAVAYEEAAIKHQGEFQWNPLKPRN
jgi:hypothetical protein